MKDLYEMLYKLMKLVDKYALFMPYQAGELKRINEIREQIAKIELVDKYALFMPYQADELKRINEIREQIAKIESEGLGIMED
jgi:ribosomal protein L29